MLERFGVAAALEKTAELGIDLRRQGLFEAIDFFGDFAQTFRMPIGIAAAFFCRHNGEAPERFDERKNCL